MSNRDLDVDPVLWSGAYMDIARRLGLDPEEDRKSTRNADEIFRGRGDELAELTQKLRLKIAGRPAVIFGCGPSLDQHVKELRVILSGRAATLIAADGATSALLEAGIRPDIIVTDLDGYAPDIVSASRQGTLIILHFHGDNQKIITKYLPTLKNVIPVTQTEPTKVVRNFGGFTDGDKCLFIAVAFGASLTLLVGMDFGCVAGPRSGSGAGTGMKKVKKLEIGRALCQDLISRSDIDVFTLSQGSMEGAHDISPQEARIMLEGGPGNA